MIPAELFISLRYLMTKRKEKFISLISVISILGIAIGVMALIAVIAVMSGFDRDLRDKIVGNYSHITITRDRGIDYSRYPELEKKLLEQPHIKAASPYLQGQVLVVEGSRYFAVGLRGIKAGKEKDVTRISDYIIKGSLSGLGAGTVVIGKELALTLGLDIGSKFTVYSPLGDKFELEVCGIFNSGMYEYDLNLVFVDLGLAQKMMGMEGRIGAIALKLDNMYLAKEVRKELFGSLGFEYTYRTWMEANQSFFAALKLEKITMFIILTLIILVASFNIVSTLIVLVVEKTRDIGILRSIGMSAKGIGNIFTMTGIVIGTAGTFLGVAGGLLLCWLIKKYQFVKLPADIYYIDRIPVYLQLWPDLALVVFASLAITMVSTIFPAKKASQLDPVEALRYE